MMEYPFGNYPFCDKCKRYYNPSIQHVCVMEDYSVTRERKRLERWLGDGWEVVI